MHTTTIKSDELQTLRASEHRYHALFENMLNGFAYCRMLYDGDGRPDDFVYLEVNPAFGRLVGLNDVVGKRVTEVIPGIKESHPDLFEIYGRVASSGEPASFEFHLEILDIWFSISAYSPEPDHFAAVFDNITERKQALKQLIDTKEEWERTFDAIVDPVMILGPRHEILRANKAMSALVGATPFAISGLLCHECLHGSGTPPTSCPHAKLMADGKPHAEEIHVPMLGLHFAVVVSPLFGPDGELQGSIHYARDITRQKALEAQLRHSQKMEAIGTLAGGVAHDFNNILTAIIGYGTLLLRQLSEGTQSWDFTNGILQAADRAAGLTSSLLAFSRKKEVELKVVSLNQVVSEAQNILRRLVREDIELRPKLGPGELTVLADQGQLEQVLINFAVNSQDAIHGPGVITIGTESFPVDCDFVKSTGCGTPGSYALLTFTDSGGGMDEETVQRIFEPFFTTKEVGRGWDWP